MSRDLCLDLFEEGFLVDVVTIVIALIKDEIFDLHHFNDIIFHFEYSGNDKNNKQQVAKKKQWAEVNQAAYEMWTLIRLWHLIIDDWIPRGNLIWNIYVKFSQIFEMLWQIEFTNLDLLLLQEEIDIFFPKFGNAFPDVSMKPKGYYLQHYPPIILKFGPLV